MIKVFHHVGDVVTVVITPEFKEVTVTSPNLGARVYHAPIEENEYGSMGSYINSWLQALNGLKPVIVM